MGFIYTRLGSKDVVMKRDKIVLNLGEGRLRRKSVKQKSL